MSASDQTEGCRHPPAFSSLFHNISGLVPVPVSNPTNVIFICHAILHLLSPPITYIIITVAASLRDSDGNIFFYENAAQPCSAPIAPLEPIAQPTATITNLTTDDTQLHSTYNILQLRNIRRAIVGVAPCWALPTFDHMMPSRAIPATPRVISPSPTPSETSQDGYSGPMTRASARKRVNTPQAIAEGLDDESSDSSTDATGRRPRPKSRSPVRVRKTSGISKAQANGVPEVQDEALLSPAKPSPSTAWSWREFSRSPSPLGLIPIHTQFRAFIHKHEVPRKALHVSIGFFTLWAYVSGSQTSAIPPYLMAALVPIAATDYLRFRFPYLNRIYVRALGALMRETEYNSWNGVIWYLLGTWSVLYFLPKDVSVVAVLLLSWCDTAASTFGRAWGRYTPRIRKGKSVAGTAAAFIVGVVTALGFWGWLSPRTGPFPGDDEWPFMFTGVLRLPGAIQGALSLTDSQSTIGGGVALTVMSLWTGFVAAASEAVDIFGWDDNLTIPVLSGIGIWGFLKVFG
ncbi:hypothetical protein V495_05401 [Pseudogymnoascus sp. VKM F-4514 (FW-929)]|nr:hypothetical protein V495_05401 [Pseudogymnoascus sp. VKM F-4514 (FW-929)]KFY56775.1 hypothetical protein V497_05987 [Pseudogymnoascus sp. VKM F-4516 (FW-969)]